MCPPCPLVQEQWLHAVAVRRQPVLKEVALRQHRGGRGLHRTAHVWVKVQQMPKKAQSSQQHLLELP